MVPVLVLMLEIRAGKSDSHNGELKWRVECVGERLSDRRPVRLPL